MADEQPKTLRLPDDVIDAIADTFAANLTAFEIHEIYAEIDSLEDDPVPVHDQWQLAGIREAARRAGTRKPDRP